jgi:photosystem II stability/assembly factor-like uncharacterized protein
MRIPRFLCIIFATLLALLAEKNSCAQWKNVAPNIFTQTSNNWGAMCFKDGKLIVGVPGASICISSNEGKTWQIIHLQVTLSGLFDLDLFDRNNGIITDYLSGLFITHDGGLTWTRLSLQSSCSSAKFTKTENDIVAGKHYGSILISHDVGNSWTQINTAGFSSQNVVRIGKADNSINAIEDASPAHIYSSYDDGASWTMRTGSFYSDCFDFAIDPCNENRLYVMNEGNVTSGPDGNGHIFLSQDKGTSFNPVMPKNMQYYCGNLIVAPRGTIYVQTQTSDGILRSTDHGLSWSSIGGPSGFSDSRLICCKDDNTLFAVDKSGSIWATYNSGGDSIQFIPGNGNLTILPQKIFFKDTIHCNDSVIRTLRLSYGGCSPPSISNWLVIGNDSLNYRVGNLTHDSIQVTFTPKTSGDHTSFLLLFLSDGSIDTINLKGYNDSKPFMYSYNPLNLFGGDSLYVCNLPKEETIILNTGGCLPKIISQNIIGADANDYQVIKRISAPLLNLDSILISFHARDSGARNATYEITFDDGTQISIPLQGYGISPHPLSIATSNQSTDTIGGSIYVPITISGLDHTEDIELVLHYEKDLKYEGSYSGTIQLDIANEQWPGRSKLHISQAKRDVILGYAKFDVFGDSIPSHVTFDSVTILTAKSPCQYILPASVTSTITPPSGCGIQTLTHFLRDSLMPRLSVVPNPTSGEVSITSTVALGEVIIAVYDMLGIKQNIIYATLQKNIPAKILLPSFNGVYNLVVQTLQNSWNLRAVVSH